MQHYLQTGNVNEPFHRRKGTVHLSLWLILESGVVWQLCIWFTVLFHIYPFSLSLFKSSTPDCLSLDLCRDVSFPAAVVNGECHIRLPSHSTQTPYTMVALIFHWLSLGKTKTQCESRELKCLTLLKKTKCPYMLLFVPQFLHGIKKLKLSILMDNRNKQKLLKHLVSKNKTALAQTLSKGSTIMCINYHFSISLVQTVSIILQHCSHCVQ